MASASPAITLGMAGDSLTDDYLGGPADVNNDLAALSWGQVLLSARGTDFDFGDYKPVGEIWDNVRYSGSEYNWATSGGVASDNAVLNIVGLPNPLPVTVSGSSVLSTQTAGLAQQIADGDVSTAYVGIGNNDFFYHTTSFDLAGNFIPNPDAVIDQAFIDDVAGSILTGVDTLRAAGPVDLLLGLLPPGTAGESAPEVIAGIDAVNDILREGAAARGIPVLDVFSWVDDPARVDPDGSVLIGDLVIELGTSATAADLSLEGQGPCNSLDLCALPSHAENYIAEDGIHTNTLINGLIANEMIDALNASYGHSISPLSDAEILRLAGVPEPTSGALLVLGLALLASRRA